MILHGDCLELMPTLDRDSVDAVVTDPPYGLGFMGKHWDHGVPNVDFWREMYRVLKPGGHLLSFGGTRTVHRIAANIEDAGFEIRDMLMWIYASGFPKSLDVGKAMDKAAGAEREIVKGGGRSNVGTGRQSHGDSIYSQVLTDGTNERTVKNDLSLPATDLARQWDGWGTALKPAHEPIVMARKPLVGTVAGNVAKWGTGAINVDGTRIGTTPRTTHADGNHQGTHPAPMDWGEPTGHATEGAAGRWPSNILLSDPELFDQPNPYVVGSGATTVSNDSGMTHTKSDDWGFKPEVKTASYKGDSGGYSRFFIIPKASRAERERGLAGDRELFDDRTPPQRANVHPTVKPIDLMRHLVRLVTPPGGTVLDPFLGSGTTAIACELEGFQWIGMEREAEYVAIAEGRILAAPRGLGL